MKKLILFMFALFIVTESFAFLEPPWKRTLLGQGFGRTRIQAQPRSEKDARRQVPFQHSLCISNGGSFKKGQEKTSCHFIGGLTQCQTTIKVECK